MLLEQLLKEALTASVAFLGFREPVWAPIYSLAGSKMSFHSSVHNSKNRKSIRRQTASFSDHLLVSFSVLESSCECPCFTRWLERFRFVILIPHKVLFYQVLVLDVMSFSCFEKQHSPVYSKL